MTAEGSQQQGLANTGRMKRHTQSVALVPLLSGLLSLVAGCATLPPEVRVTYIANEGFLLQAGPHKIIVDGLFGDGRIDFCDVPAPELLTRVEQGVPPFTDIDLVLVTHAHVDHFDAASVSRFLKNHRQCKVVCPGQVRGAIQDTMPDYAAIRDQVVVPAAGLDGGIDLTINRMKVRALPLRHGSYMVKDETSGTEYDLHEKVEHLAYLIELSGRRILHVGDASLRTNRERLTRLGVPLDIAFVEGYDISQESLHLMATDLKPKHVVYVHLPRQDRQKLIDAITARNPTGTIFTEPLEERTFR
jgi:L-ascorbate metabolism protein UlaG (beta-lactamase superfamily)